MWCGGVWCGVVWCGVWWRGQKRMWDVILNKNHSNETINVVSQKLLKRWQPGAAFPQPFGHFLLLPLFFPLFLLHPLLTQASVLYYFHRNSIRCHSRSAMAAFKFVNKNQKSKEYSVHFQRGFSPLDIKSTC